VAICLSLPPPLFRPFFFLLRSGVPGKSDGCFGCRGDEEEEARRVRRRRRRRRGDREISQRPFHLFYCVSPKLRLPHTHGGDRERKRERERERAVY